ncbi:hypothetical protein ACFL3Y_02040 [Pseudomonadota bacterium]
MKFLTLLGAAVLLCVSTVTIAEPPPPFTMVCTAQAATTAVYLNDNLPGTVSLTTTTTVCESGGEVVATSVDFNTLANTPIGTAALEAIAAGCPGFYCVINDFLANTLDLSGLTLRTQAHYTWNDQAPRKVRGTQFATSRVISGEGARIGAENLGLILGDDSGKLGRSFTAITMPYESDGLGLPGSVREIILTIK